MFDRFLPSLKMAWLAAYDVPALDAVLFLTPRNSQVDVVQSVGRVMRKPKDSKKKLGYVILPVVIPAGMQPEEALKDNKTYKVVWEVLQELRSHDDRFDAMINKLDLTGQDKSKMEIIAITDTINIKSKAKANETKGAKVNGKAAKAAKGGQNLGQSAEATPLQLPPGIRFRLASKIAMKTRWRKSPSSFKPVSCMI